MGQGVRHGFDDCPDQPAPDAGRQGRDQAEKVARLEAENASMRAEKAKIETEKKIVRQAAKYFAGETNW